MNEKNFEYLRDQVKFTGFGEGLEEELKEKMQEQKASFIIEHEAYYGEDVARVTLNFKKSEQGDKYFFNSYQIGLLKEHAKEAVQQTFYIHNANNITMKEAYNLMDGRAVNKDLTSKEGQGYNAWLQMDFEKKESNGNFKLNQYHQNYGYDLESALSKHAIKELENPKYKKELIDSLKKGNLQSVSFLKEGKQIKQFVAANPQFKTLTLYDGDRKRIDTRLEIAEKQEEGIAKVIKQDGKKQTPNVDEETVAVPQGKTRRKKQSNSM
jgi:hypothetical protein